MHHMATSFYACESLMFLIKVDIRELKLSIITFKNNSEFRND